jgi:cysteine synthase A
MESSFAKGPGGEVASREMASREVAPAELASTEVTAAATEVAAAHEGVLAHETTTGPEIWTQAGGKGDAWVAAVGSGATFIGVATALRWRNPRILCAAVEPAGCQPLAGLIVEKTRHLLQGTSYGSVPPHWDASLMDVSLPVDDDEVEHWRQVVATREGLHVGYSAAANVCAAYGLLRSGLPVDAVVATVLCDTGLKH